MPKTGDEFIKTREVNKLTAKQKIVNKKKHVQVSSSIQEEKKTLET